MSVAMNEPTPNTRHRAVSVLLFVGFASALALLFVWKLGADWRQAEDPRIAEIKQLQREMFAKHPPGQEIRSSEDAAARVAAMGQLMAKVQQLPPELRLKAMSTGRGHFKKMIDGKMSQYFSLPPEKRQAFIDREIAQMEFMRKAFEAGRTVMTFLGGGAQGNSGKASRPQPPFMMPGESEDARNKFRKDMIDQTTPEQRARIVEFIGAIDRRRTQLGLPAMPAPPQ